MVLSVIFAIMWHANEREAKSKAIIHDTVIVHHTDTIQVTVPPDTVTNTVTKLVPVPQYIRDTDTITDTIVVALPFEQHFAKLEDVADVWFSGFQAKIDSAVVYRNTITEIIRQPVETPSPANMVTVTAGISDASLGYMRRIGGRVWVGASAGYSYTGVPSARATIGLQF